MLQRGWEYGNGREREHGQRAEVQRPRKQMSLPPLPSTPRLGSIELDDELDEVDEAPVEMFDDLGALEKRIELELEGRRTGSG